MPLYVWKCIAVYVCYLCVVGGSPPVVGGGCLCFSFPVVSQNPDPQGGCRLKRIVLIGDHNPPGSGAPFLYPLFIPPLRQISPLKVVGAYYSPPDIRPPLFLTLRAEGLRFFAPFHFMWYNLYDPPPRMTPREEREMKGVGWVLVYGKPSPII